MTTIQTELLDFAPGAELVHYDNEEAPLPFAVWLGDEIIGAGETRLAAIADAAKQVLAWENAS